MAALVTFLLAFGFSFVGSIPPGTLNLTVVQLGLQNRLRAARRFAIAAAIIEYPYAWIALKFERLITASPLILDNIQLLAAVVMTVLGIISLIPVKNPSKLTQKFSESGFRQGIVLSILNPLAIPYWIGVTAYLKSQQWIDLSNAWRMHSYLLGVSAGGFLLLILLAYLAKKVVSGFLYNPWVKKVPGIILLSLGIYAFLNYML